MKTNMYTLKIIVITIFIVGIISAYIAGGCYSKGYYAGRRDGYKKCCDEHKVTLDSLSAEYKEAIDSYNEATYWYNKVRLLYEAKLETSLQTDKLIEK